ncbi:DNA helicase [Malassezia sp. CBS 17886]|nr:DNA helicase [Malassezia sp. CBS 17886]
MSGTNQDPVVLAPDSSPTACSAAHDVPSSKRHCVEGGSGTVSPFRRSLEAFQYQGPAAPLGSRPAAALHSEVSEDSGQTDSSSTGAGRPLEEATSSPAAAARSVPSDSIVQIKATRLARLFSSYTVEQCTEVLRASHYDLGEAIEKLRPKTVPAPAPPPPQPPSAAMPRAASPAPSPAARGAPKRAPKRKSRAASDSDSDASISLDGASSDEEEFGDADGRQEQQEQQALVWFNQCDATGLVDSINCSPAQANTIVGLQPFASVDDVYERLGDKSAKGVSPRLFANCVELMAGYMEVDEVLAKCEAIGQQLDSAMSASRTTTSESGDDSAGAESLAAVRQNGTAQDEHCLEEQPTNLAAGVVLKDYQLLGVRWLYLLYEKKTSCILADEMGLGKTAQVIAFLALLKLKRIRRGPHLVVAPSSVLENWSREFQHFCPSLSVEVYYGSQSERRMLRADLKSRDDYDVLLTTYDMATGSPDDQAFLRKRGFDVRARMPFSPQTCVFDEGHMLKNRRSQKYAKLLRISTRWRLLLTGTPLQNNLQELVSLLNFILPDYFTDAEEALAAIFKVKPGANTSQLSQQRVERAKRMMRPFVLRRKKDKVLKGLTAKTERVEYCDLTESQQQLYSDALQRTKAALTDDAPPEKKDMRDTSNVLMDLRKAANHPLLFRRLYGSGEIAALARDYIREPEHADENIQHLREDFAINTDAELSLLAHSWKKTQKHVLPAPAWMDSGKVRALTAIIEEVRARGDRMLVFSQFTSVLDILCVALEHLGVPYVGFTGQTKVGDRQVLVDQFSNDSSIPVFLLSTRAGGLGINLVAANWVVLFDQDVRMAAWRTRLTEQFNPQNDKQATDRCYRIGQTKPVHVVKLISRGTIDEDILSLASHKLELAERVSNGTEPDEETAREVESAVKDRLASSLLSKVRNRAEQSTG